MAQNKNKAAKNAKGKVSPLYIVAALAIVVAAGSMLGNPFAKKPTAAQPEGKVFAAAVATDADLVIPVSEVSETASFYPVDIDGTRLEVVAVKAPDGTVRTAFNTCQICYDSGRGYYKQQGDVLICQNCGNQFAMSRVEVEAGGCNPWPIFADNKTVTDESITISADFFRESQGIFENWKRSY